MNEAVMSAPLVQVDVGLFADKVGVTTANTLDLGQGVHDLALAINVGVEETQDVLYPKRQRLFFGDDGTRERTWNCWWGSGTWRDMVDGGGK